MINERIGKSMHGLLHCYVCCFFTPLPRPTIPLVRMHKDGDSNRVQSVNDVVAIVQKSRYGRYGPRSFTSSGGTILAAFTMIAAVVILTTRMNPNQALHDLPSQPRFVRGYKKPHGWPIWQSSYKRRMYRKGRIPTQHNRVPIPGA
jgi:hypothetical protein